jgi:hypothetical protein
MIYNSEGVPCTFVNDRCPLDASYWGYQPSLGANVAFTVLFSLSTIAFLAQGVVRKRWLGFTVAMASGCVIEVIGYVGRVMAHHDMFDEVSSTDLSRPARR